MFRVTNEDLQAIVEGLDVQADDIVLAICGSGDQALALLEFASRVIAVDNNNEQLKFARKKIDDLVALDPKRFVHEYYIVNALHMYGFIYFSVDYDLIERNYGSANVERLQRIRDKIPQLELRLVRDISDALPIQGLTKIYLSNILLGDKDGFEAECRYLENLANNLPVGGLIYYGWEDPLTDGSGADKERYWPRNLVVDEELTAKARKEFGGDLTSPIVYRKIP
ncbi:DUF3419 family protein [Candidatus Woesearchaeota archaeon]|nr:DUF3419 family protein [Candidatus Woesearchaeota archaeon]